MATTISWREKIIHIPRADLTLIQAFPTEIRQLDLNLFRLDLKDLEDDEEGMAELTTHSHNATVNVGGVELARVVEIINGYTVTFEDGQYAVNLYGANSNVGDVVNVNQVSVRSANSAGLVSSQAIEFGEYGGGVTIDTTNGESGTIYPIGTERRPVNNVDDANIIADSRGFRVFFIKNDITFVSGDDITDRIIIGENATHSMITLDPGAITPGCEIQEASVTGTLDGDSIIRNAVVTDLTYVNGFIFQSMLNGTTTLGGSSTAFFLNCFSGIPGETTPIINMSGDTPLAFRGYNGGVKLINKTGNASVSVDLVAGQVVIDSSCVAGTIVVRGAGKVVDENGDHLSSGVINGALTLINECVYGEHLHDVWRIHGLDADSPVTVTPTTRVAGDLTQDISGDGETTTTITRT